MASWPSVAAQLEDVDPVVDTFTDDEVADLPEPVHAFFARAITPGTPLAAVVRLVIRGHIRLGGRWVAFRSREVLAPCTGLVWWGRVGGVVAGGDCALAGEGRMRWKFFGVKTVARADGVDVARSGLARAFGEGVLWAPTAVLPRAGVTWSAPSDDAITATLRTPFEEVVVHITLDEQRRPLAAVFDRWGDPDATGAPALHPFGGVVHEWARFDRVTIAARGAVGWGFGTPAWPQGEFFRYEVTACDLVTG